MLFVRPVLVANVIVAALTLASCSSPRPTKTVTAAPLPSVTVTATATPNPEDVLTPLGAWTICYAFLTRFASRSDVNFVIPQLRTYDPQWVTPTPQGQQVQISPANLPGDWTCTITGTAGAPKIVSWSTDN